MALFPLQPGSAILGLGAPTGDAFHFKGEEPVNLVDAWGKKGAATYAAALGALVAGTGGALWHRHDWIKSTVWRGGASLSLFVLGAVPLVKGLIILFGGSKKS